MGEMAVNHVFCAMFPVSVSTSTKPKLTRAVLAVPLQPLVFGAMIHRDEAFEAIFTQYMKIMTTTKPPGNPEL